MKLSTDFTLADYMKASAEAQASADPNSYFSALNAASNRIKAEKQEKKNKELGMLSMLLSMQAPTTDALLSSVQDAVLRDAELKGLV